MLHRLTSGVAPCLGIGRACKSTIHHVSGTGEQVGALRNLDPAVRVVVALVPLLAPWWWWWRRRTLPLGPGPDPGRFVVVVFKVEVGDVVVALLPFRFLLLLLLCWGGGGGGGTESTAMSLSSSSLRGTERRRSFVRLFFARAFVVVVAVAVAVAVALDSAMMGSLARRSFVRAPSAGVWSSGNSKKKTGPIVQCCGARGHFLSRTTNKKIQPQQEAAPSS
jgi:hypothetical protein